MIVEQMNSSLDELESCLMNSSQAQFSLREKYLKLSARKEGSIVIWNPKSSWFVEAEIKDGNGSFLQRKVIMELSPGDFFILPSNLPDGLSLFARSHKNGICHFTLVENLLSKAKSSSLLKSIANSISFALVQLSEFEKVSLRPSLNRPRILKPSVQTRLSPGQMGLSGENHLWVSSDNLDLKPSIEALNENRPNFYFMYEGKAVINHGEESCEIRPYSNVEFFGKAGIIELLDSQFLFHWSELCQRWKNKLNDRKVLTEEHAARSNIYTQSVRSRLLNLLSGENSYLPNTNNQTLRAAFYLINLNGWIPNIPKNTESEDTFGLLSRVADSSGLIIRKSTLKGRWSQNKDSGSFISFRRDGGPVVFFFKGGKYQGWDPVNGKFFILNEKMQEDFTPQVIYFYKQLPNRPLTFFDLLFFEIQSIRSEIAIVLFLALIVSGLIALMPVFSAFVVNFLLPGAHMDLLVIVCAGLVLIGVFQTIFNWFDTMIMSRIDYKLSLASSAAIWHRVLHFPANILSQHASGDIAMKVNSCLSMQQFFRMVIQRFITMGFQVVASIGVIYWVNFQVGMGVLGFGVIALAAAIIFTYWQIRAFMAGEKSLGIVNSFILEIYSGIHKIKSSAAEQQFLHQWAERYSRLRKKILSSQRVRILHSSFQAGWVTITTALVYWLIVGLSDINLEPGLFIAFLGAFAVFSGNLSSLCSLIVQSGIQIPIYKFIKILFDKSPICKADLLIPEKVNGELKVDRVTHYYPGQNKAAVQQVSILIKQGSFVVIAGISGSGKSTLGKLLCGIEQPLSGQVFLDDYELNTLDPTSLRSNIAFVPQDFRLINGTLYENIIGASQALQEDVISAAKAACIWEEISELPMQLHTLTGTHFSAFSGGQIQRIAIARALIRKPRILVMDEATSALDNNLQDQIIRNLKAMNCTIVFIAHRLKIAEHADEILVLESGEIVERGNHTKLLCNGKYYTKMWQAMS